MKRSTEYMELVERRRTHKFPDGLLNPSMIRNGKFDSDHLGPWSRWQGSLDADVIVVGQDWGDESYFLRNQGIDDDQEQTCTNLRALVSSAGWDIGTPHAPISQRLFFTNAVLGIREQNGKSGTPPQAWVDDSLPFLSQLLEIVRPKAIVSLGTSAYRACRLAMHARSRDNRLPVSAPLGRIHQQSPILRPGKPAWFVFYHCGPLGLVNHSKDLQLQDWRMLGEWLREHIA